MAGELDVVVVNYRTPDLLEDFIESFWHTIDYSGNLIVIDVDPIKEFKKIHHGTYVSTDSNIGYGRACNLGASLGESPNIAFFNSDVRILEHSVMTCLYNLHKEKDIAVVGPYQVNERSKVTHAGIFGTHAQPKLHGWNKPDDLKYRDNLEAISVSGSAYFTKRNVWDELTACPIYSKLHPGEGAFLPTPHYYEETWYSYHAAAHGYKVIYCGEAKMIHLWHKSSKLGEIEKVLPVSRKMFRDACDVHGIDRD